MAVRTDDGKVSHLRFARTPSGQRLEVMNLGVVIAETSVDALEVKAAAVDFAVETTPVLTTKGLHLALAQVMLAAPVQHETPPRRPFKGAAFVIRQTLDRLNSDVAEIKLQWGRGLSTAETPGCWGRGDRLGGASMGPRSFDRGNTAPAVLRVSTL